MLARPGLSGNDGWVRSRAWHWVFSSKLNTTARSGGSRYRPTTSTSFSSKWGSFDSLNVSTRHGRRFLARQIRATVSLPTPWRSPIVRVDQHVDSSSGVECSVSSTIASTVSWGISGLRPRPGPMAPTASVPPASNLWRHRRTVSGVVEHSRAIASFAAPSAASSRADAWTTIRWGSEGDFAIRSSSERCLRDTRRRGAVITGMLPA